MLEHIVKYGENIEEILETYKVSLEELKIVNMHITDFRNLVAGTKVKIPLISEEIEQILEKTESFVMNYYPKVTTEIIESNSYEKKEVKVQEELKSLPRGRAYPGILPPKTKNKWENR